MEMDYEQNPPANPAANPPANPPANLIVDDLVNNLADNLTIEPLPQYAQKCAWCNMYLLSGDDTVIYSGPDQRFTNWICHARCQSPRRVLIRSSDPNDADDETDHDPVYELDDLEEYADHDLSIKEYARRQYLRSLAENDCRSPLPAGREYSQPDSP